MRRMIETHPLISVRSSVTVDEAARLMADCGMGSIGVLDADHNFQGIFTERDLTALIGRAQPPTEIKLAEVVNDFPVVVDGPISFAEAAEQMRSARIRHLIVKEGEDFRIVSMRDLVAIDPASLTDKREENEDSSATVSMGYLASFAGPLPMRAEDIMTSPAIAVRGETRLEEVAEILSDKNISGAPVVDDEGRVLGVISERDVALTFGSPLVRIAIRNRGPHPTHRYETPGVHVARAVMTTPAITASRDTPVTTLAEIMFKEKVNRLPIVKGDRLVGIVTRGDVLGAFAGLPQEEQEQVREPVVLGGTWQTPW